MRPIIIATLLFICLQPSCLLAAPDGSSVHITVSSDRLSISGLTPGGGLVLFGISARPLRGVIAKKQIAEILPDADRDGVVAYEPADGIPFRSVWVAIDLATGAYSVAAPEHYALDHAEIQRKALAKDADGLVEALDLDAVRSEVLLVRPGASAWRLHAFEGGSGDGDRTHDGRLRVIFDQFRSLDGSAAKSPKKAKKGDVLALIEPVRLEVRTVVIE